MKKITLMLTSALLILGTQTFAEDGGGASPTGAGVGAPGAMGANAGVCECNLNPSGIIQTKSKQFDELLPHDAGTPGSPTPANGAGGTK